MENIYLNISIMLPIQIQMGTIYIIYLTGEMEDIANGWDLLTQGQLEVHLTDGFNKEHMKSRLKLEIAMV